MKPVLLYGLLAALFLSFGSCKNTDDEFLPDDVLPPVKDGYVRMQITVPGLTPVSTYALSETDEYSLSEVDVLVFDAAGKYLCRAYAQGQDIITDSSNSNKKTFDVYLDGAGNATGACVMVVANAHDAVEAANATSPFTSSVTTKEDVTSALEFDSSGKWNAAGSANFRPFPMWGCLSPVDLSNTASVPVPSIALLRSVAKIDVEVNLTGGASFILESVRLYNSLKRGLAAPLDGNPSVTDPAIPPSLLASDINDPISYLHGVGDDFSNNLSCTNVIYMAEQFAEPAVDGGGPAKRPCLVIGGRYGSSTANITYYRLDFVSGSYPNQEFLDVLRNHRYRFNITKVDGPGYDTAQEAFDAAPVNLTVSLTATDESLTSYVYDGQYALGVSQDTYVLNNKQQTVALDISATYGSYSAAASSTGNWLRFGSVIGSGDIVVPAVSVPPAALGTLTFNVTANTGSDARTGIITVTSGRLEIVITVIQYPEFYVSTPQTDPFAAGTAGTALTVRSPYNNWYVRVDSDPKAIVSGFSPVSGNITTGTNVALAFRQFSDWSNSITETATATLTFFSPTGEFDPETRTVQLTETLYTPPTDITPSTHNGWAGSNIYWNSAKGCLTFDDTPTSNPAADASGSGSETYQGVHFKWGSLIGVDPSDVGWGTGATVYIPDPSTQTWTVAKAGTGNSYNTWANILTVSGGTVGTDRAHLTIDKASGGGYDPVNKLGDICRYLTETGHAPGKERGTRWRMPVANEFGAAADYGTTLGSWNSSTANANDYGTWTVTGNPGCRKNNSPIANYRPFFPASGQRNVNGVRRLIGAESTYWSSSPSTGVNAYLLIYYANGNKNPLHTGDRLHAMSVRCVKE
ncbi:MAG: FimB/Mfa2 family fimbrial subunit [Prevotella sp.]|jgi:hypothetical protein|nr:FimB/Mfa2 family fimbrial subunit [Prevotella sp.]